MVSLLEQSLLFAKQSGAVLDISQHGSYFPLFERRKHHLLAALDEVVSDQLVLCYLRWVVFLFESQVLPILLG